MKWKAPWGCNNPYCWDHVITAVLIFGVPLAAFLYQVFRACNGAVAPELEWLR